MAPRRGGEGGAGAQVGLIGGRGYFEPPPLKRMHPWQQDGSGQCDILAGGVDESGNFKGVYMSGVHLMALLRTLQLSKAFMPVDTPTPVAALGQSIHDGIPIVVVTRGCFGRAKDHGAGPLRNELQKSVWETCRQMRADMPQVLITCIDLPINCGAEIVQGCLETPLNEYHELMYHEGTWYAPSVISAAGLAKWKAEYKKEKSQPVGGGVNFNRKKFGWVDEAAFYKDIYTIGWKEVLQVKAPPAVPQRTDLNFVNLEQPKLKPIEDLGPSAALATLRKVLAQAREASDAKQMLAGIKAYLDRAKWSEKNGLEEAIQACSEVAQLLQSEPLEACKATGMAVETYIYMNQVEKALQMATELKASAKNAKVEVKTARLVLNCHFALGDMDAALEAAKQAKTAVASKNDPEALCEACGLVVSSFISKGEVEEAVSAATEATKASDKASQAKGWLLVAEAQIAKASQATDESVKVPCWQEVAKAQKTARGLYKDLGLKKEEGEALQGAAAALMEADDLAQALALAKELEAFAGDAAGDAEAAGLAALGSQLVASAHLRSFYRSDQYLEGGEEAMLTAAKQAVASFEKLGDTTRRGAAQQTLREAIRAATKNI